MKNLSLFFFIACLMITMLVTAARAASSRDGECRNKSCPSNHVKVWVEGSDKVTVFNMRDCACLCIPEAQ